MSKGGIQFDPKAASLIMREEVWRAARRAARRSNRREAAYAVPGRSVA